MSTLTTILLIILLVLALLTLLRLRLQLRITPKTKTLFIGLGYTGLTTDFRRGTRSVFFAGVKVSQKAGRWRFPSFDRLIKIIPRTIKAFLRYVYSLLKSVTVEEFEGEINAGFEQPHLTGTAFGFYRAALAGAPSVVGRFRFIPDWSGASFGGNLKASVSIPVYRIIYRTMVLVFQLPLRELIKLAIGRKKKGK